MKLASLCIISIAPETVTSCHENDGDLDTKWELLNPFECGWDLRFLPKVVSAEKLSDTKEGGARAFIYASLEEQGEGDEPWQGQRSRGIGNSKGKSKRKIIT